MKYIVVLSWGVRFVFYTAIDAANFFKTAVIHADDPENVKGMRIEVEVPEPEPETDNEEVTI